MKKIFFYLFAFVAILGGLTACGDNENVSSVHILTDDEIAQMEYLDSLKKAQLERVDVDLLLDYEAHFYVSDNSYDGAYVYIDTVQIADLFGITPTQLAEGFWAWWYPEDYPNAPKISGFAIEGSTHNDNLTASTSGSMWGHWWSATGDVTEWAAAEGTAAQAMLFTEYDPDEGSFHVGQFPTRLTAGSEYTIIEGLSYQGKRVGVRIKVYPEAREEVKAEVVNTQSLSLSVAPNDAYATTLVEFDLEKTLADLGISSIADAAFVALKPDGSYAQEYTAAPNGYYYDLDGFAGSWGENASIFITHPATGGDEETTENYIAVGQMPGAMSVGDQITVKFGIMANNKIEMLEVTVNIIDYIDPETKPEGDPYEKTIDVTLTKGYTSDWSGAVSYTEIQEILRDAFKMTTYELYSANKTGAFKMYAGEVTEEEPDYTAAAPGYWLDGNGAVTGFGTNSAVFAELHMSETSIDITVGNHPDFCDPNGMTIPTIPLICVVDGNAGKVTVNLSIVITAFVDPEETPTGDPYDMEEALELSLDYNANDMTWGGDTELGEKVKDAFKVTTYQFSQLLESGEMQLYLNEITDPAPAQCWAGEFYVDADGNAVEKEEDAAYVVGFYPAGTELYVEVGNYPAKTAAGSVLKTTLIAVAKGVTVKIPITCNVVEAAE